MAATYVYETNSFKVVTQSLSNPGTVSVEQDAFIHAGSGDAFALAGNGWTFKIDGTIEGA